MKTTILLIGLLCLLTKGYSQCDYYINEVDEFTGQTEKATKYEVIGKDKTRRKLKARVASVGEEVILFLSYYGDLGCVASKSTAILKLESGEMIELKHVGKIDCDDVGLFTLRLEPDEVETLKSNHVTKARLTGTKYLTDVDWYFQTYFRDRLPCVVN